jgi:flavodoxin
MGLWPVFSECRPEPAYVTLVEALALDGFKVTEISEGGSVPNLRVINESPHHVLLFDGEEMKGAKQNRILNTTILIAAGTAIDVPVSCTEQGRWSYASAEFGSSGSLAYAELRKRKSVDVAINLKAHAIHASDQGAVWEEIESLHMAAKSSGKTRTRAMKDAYNESQQELDNFTRELPVLDGQCGLLAVIGDRVEGIDLLSRPEAYAKLHRRLVESHAMDFLIRKQGVSRAPFDPEAPARFLAEAAKAEDTMHATPGLGSDHRMRFRWGHGAALRVDETIVHLALFGGGGLGQGHHPTEAPLRRRQRAY